MALVDVFTADNVVSNAGQVDQLLSKLQEYYISKNTPDLDIQAEHSPKYFLSKLDSLQDYYYDTTSNLRRFDLANHHYFWLYSIEALVDQLIKFKVFYDGQILNNFHHNPNGVDAVTNSIGLKLGKLCGDFGGILSHFIYSDDMKLEKFLGPTINYELFDRLSNVIIKSLEVIVIDKSEDAQYIDNAPATLTALSTLVLNFYKYINTLNYGKDALYLSFPALCQFLKVAYCAGESETILPLLAPFKKNLDPIINPRLPIQLVQESTVHLHHLIDFYRYTAFNLLSLALRGDKIDDFFANLAAIYFNVLLNFPNLSLRAYREIKILPPHLSELEREELENEDEPKSLVPLEERQEISFLFIINYILSATSLSKLTDPDEYFSTELNFLVNSLSTSISSDLDRSASHSGSHSNSIVSLHPLDDIQQSHGYPPRKKQYNRIKFKSLSTIISYGTYKEKLSLIVKFLELFKPETISTSKIISTLPLNASSDLPESDVQHIVSNIDNNHYPGKMLYVSTLYKITQLVKILGIKQLVLYGGINNISETQLNNIFGCNIDIETTMNVKKLVDFEINSDNIVTFSPIIKHDKQADEKTVQKQLQIFLQTKQLQAVAEALQ